MKQTFSVLSYNIQAGIGTQRAHHYVTRAHHHILSTKAKRSRLRAMGHFIRPYDLVCLQEVDPGGRRAGFSNQGEYLRDVSQHPHYVFQENRSVRAISRHGNAILSRIPIKDWHDLKLPGRIAGRGALVAELDVNPATVIVCAHLSLGLEDQTEQLAFLADHLSAEKYSRSQKIVCGDLNCGPNATPVEAFTAISGIRPLTDNSHKTYPSWAPRLGLDHILTDNPSLDHNVTVEVANFSDHRPVSAQFKLNSLTG